MRPLTLSETVENLIRGIRGVFCWPRIPRKRSLGFGCHRFEIQFSESHARAIDTGLTVTPKNLTRTSDCTPFSALFFAPFAPSW